LLTINGYETDQTTKGCNIPDIDIVIQWRLTATVSSFVQCAGRAARALGRTGLAVLLVEKSVYDVDLNKHHQDDQQSKRKKNIRQSTKYPKSKTKGYAIKHGVLRGGYSGLTDEVAIDINVPVDVSSIDEGAHSFVQSTTCRREVLTKIYGNEKAGKCQSPQ
jgi:superfamily II DNA/RNA helicase